MVWCNKKPIKSSEKKRTEWIDKFKSTKLAVEWEWNYQPRKEKWSLTECPGFLRLYAFQPIKPEDTKRIIFRAGNTLTQRSFRSTKNVVIIKMNISNMSNGQFAGLTHFASTYSTFGVKQLNGIKTLVYDNNRAVNEGVRIYGKNIWIKSSWNNVGVSKYSYSINGKKFIDFGETYQLTWGNYRGDRIGIFNFNTIEDKGFVDVDWFKYKVTN